MRVAVIGAGAIGSPLVKGLLDSSWAQHILLVDDDTVALSNLARQPWFRPDDIGQFKVDVLRKVFPNASLSVRRERVDEAFQWPSLDLIFDATDNWPARQNIAEEAFRQHIPWVFSSALRWEGQVAMMKPEGACLRCLFGETLLEGPRCFEAGVVGAVTLAVAGHALTVAESWALDSTSDITSRLWLLEGREGRLWSARLSQVRCRHGHG